MDRGGLSGDDGPTHHGLFDISYLRGVPNLIHMDPMDEDELQDMMLTALEHEGPSAIRYPRGTGPGVEVKARPVALEIGKAEVLKDGRDVAIFALGAMVAEAERLAKMLEAEGHSVAVINARFAKPIDAECVERYGSSGGMAGCVH
jgi:1-deoxy-D-xylulose-5-phosphate synthase